MNETVDKTPDLESPTFKMAFKNSIVTIAPTDDDGRFNITILTSSEFHAQILAQHLARLDENQHIPPPDGKVYYRPHTGEIESEHYGESAGDLAGTQHPTDLPLFVIEHAVSKPAQEIVDQFPGTKIFATEDIGIESIPLAVDSSVNNHANAVVETFGNKIQR